jgi:hypothetical protein
MAQEYINCEVCERIYNFVDTGSICGHCLKNLCFTCHERSISKFGYKHGGGVTTVSQDTRIDQDQQPNHCFSCTPDMSLKKFTKTDILEAYFRDSNIHLNIIHDRMRNNVKLCLPFQPIYMMTAFGMKDVTPVS